jgi:hypothetical protein
MGGFATLEVLPGAARSVKRARLTQLLAKARSIDYLPKLSDLVVPDGMVPATTARPATTPGPERTSMNS